MHILLYAFLPSIYYSKIFPFFKFTERVHHNEYGSKSEEIGVYYRKTVLNQGYKGVKHEVSKIVAAMSYVSCKPAQITRFAKINSEHTCMH